MRKLLVGIIILLLLIPSVVSVSINYTTLSKIGNTLYVGGSGPGNYSKIQDAIDDSSNGHTIFVFDDSSPYYENILVDKRINLIGEDKNKTIIDGSGKDDVVYISVNAVTISGFTIQNSGDDWDDDAGIDIHSVGNTIKGNNIRNNSHGILCKSISFNTFIANIIKNNERGISLYRVNNNLIFENTFISNRDEHLSLTHSNLNIIKNNKFRSGSKFGIRLSVSNNNNVTDNSFYHCGAEFFISTFSNISNNTVNGKPLIYMVGESNKTIREAGQIYLKDCINITIQNLDISNVSFSIHGENFSNCLIADNYFDNTLYPIYLLGLKLSSNITIINNIFYKSDYGILLEKVKDCIIKDNYFYNTDCKVSSNTDCRVSQRSTNISIINNTFIKGHWNVYLDRTTYSNISNNIISLGEYGIYLWQSSEYNFISRNIINDNNVGIKIGSSLKNNNISNNEISNNKFGVELGSKSSGNIIFHNNFIENSIHAFFFNCKDNLWQCNYWDNWIGARIKLPIFQRLPKMIFGFIGINFDWNPASEPYDIGV